MITRVAIVDRLHECLGKIPLDRWYSPMPGFFSMAPEDGEKVPRRVRQTYFDLLPHRPGPVMFDQTAVLKSMIEDEVARIVPHHQGMLPFPLVLAYAHLEDAENESLRRQDREMHYDIAGSEVWGYKDSSSSTQSFAQKFVTVWRRGNGI